MLAVGRGTGDREDALGVESRVEWRASSNTPTAQVGTSRRDSGGAPSGRGNAAPPPLDFAGRADVAQLAEHFTRNEGVPGSSPGVGFV
jgi:hypothetical protein